MRVFKFTVNCMVGVDFTYSFTLGVSDNPRGERQRRRCPQSWHYFELRLGLIVSDLEHRDKQRAAIHLRSISWFISAFHVLSCYPRGLESRRSRQFFESAAHLFVKTSQGQITAPLKKIGKRAESLAEKEATLSCDK
jgi:hypothetical protein